MTDPVSGVRSAATVLPDTTAAATATTTTTAGSKTSSSSSPLLDPQAFLQLLVAQLKYQDPSNPVDTSSFMNQTAMLSQVQTMGSMSTTLGSLAGAQQAQSATALIGRQIGYLDSHGLHQTGVVTSVDLLSSGAQLHVGPTTVPLTGVLDVSDPTPA